MRERSRTGDLHATLIETTCRTSLAGLGRSRAAASAALMRSPRTLCLHASAFCNRVIGALYMWRRCARAKLRAPTCACTRARAQMHVCTSAPMLRSRSHPLAPSGNFSLLSWRATRGEKVLWCYAAPLWRARPYLCFWCCSLHRRREDVPANLVCKLTNWCIVLPFLISPIVCVGLPPCLPFLLLRNKGTPCHLRS